MQDCYLGKTEEKKGRVHLLFHAFYVADLFNDVFKFSENIKVRPHFWKSKTRYRQISGKVFQFQISFFH